MFAFAAWDGRRRALLLARDRLGVKPLYYAELNGGIVFGSEIKSLIEDPDVSREWDPEALDAYMTLGYIPAPMTIFKAVRKLDAAHTLEITGSSPSLRQYWDLHFTGDGDPAREAEYLARTDELLHEAVRLRLISDVPLGAFLSGGIDSSAVVSTMVRTSDAPVLTMSVGFDAKEFDELEHALTVARHLGCEAHTRIVTPHVEELLPKLAWHCDEPFADSSIVPTYYVSRAAREQVTVALSGDGGDELWCGYARHYNEGVEGRVRHALGPFSRVAGLMGRLLPNSIRGARALSHLQFPAAQAYAVKHAFDYFDDDARAALYHHDFPAQIRDSDPYAKHRRLYERCESSDPIDKALYVDARTYMVDDVLAKVDKMSMAVSLETREPLLDHKLLEYVATIPSSLKLRNGTTKYLLKRLLEQRLPASILERPKQGFSAPIGQWLAGPLSTMGQQLLFDGRLAGRGVLRDSAVRQLWVEHGSGHADHRHRLWAILMLELWFREFIDTPAAQSGGIAIPLVAQTAQ
jgi:asparagine synthase (glutamine-hydrolysing)